MDVVLGMDFYPMLFLFCVHAGNRCALLHPDFGITAMGESQLGISCESWRGVGGTVVSSCRAIGSTATECSVSDQRYCCLVVFSCLFLILFFQHCDWAYWLASLLLYCLGAQRQHVPCQTVTWEYPVSCWGPPPLHNLTQGPAIAGELPREAIPFLALLFSAAASGLLPTA